jgi:hypothetical protein
VSPGAMLHTGPQPADITHTHNPRQLAGLLWVDDVVVYINKRGRVI